MYKFYGEKTPSEKTKMLLKKLHDETCIMSYHDRNHPLYKEILDIGKLAVPQLIRSLDVKQEGVWWVDLLLHDILKVDPIQEKNCGRIHGIVKDWKEWLSKNNWWEYKAEENNDN